MTDLESRDAYKLTLRRNGDHRIILCPDPLQWIIQRRTRAESLDGARWEAVYFCTSRAGLLIDYPALADVSPQEPMDFPEHVTCGAEVPQVHLSFALTLRVLLPDQSPLS